MSSGNELAAASRTMTDIAQRWMKDPAKLVEAQTDLIQDLCRPMGQHDAPHDG